MSKTDGMLDAMGWRLDTSPRPQLYVGPSKDFVVEQFEPRLMRLLDESPRLAGLVARGKRNKKVRKVVNGAPIRLAWAGSETSLASDQAGDVFVDEFDKMAIKNGGRGDVYGLAKSRADAYPDRKIAVTSTPKRGRVTVERDARSGLELWAMAEPRDLESPIWAKWQQGTRHHWAWPCPTCGEYFVPRLRNLDSAPGATPAQARRSTWLVCPRNGCIIPEDRKAEMNAAGRFVAPGQTISEDGEVEGDPPDSSMLSLWVSGLASPFLSWGERREEQLAADLLEDDEAKQNALNRVGELFARDEGAAPEWKELARLRLPYRMGDLPEGPRVLTAGIDVQGNRLVAVVAGWAARSEFWLLQAVELFGDTRLDGVWHDLIDFLRTPIGGLTVRSAFVDSGFRPGKGSTPEHKVYAVCREYPKLLRPAKGYATRSTPLSISSIEVKRGGGGNPYGLQLARLDSDYFKGWVHERLKWPADAPGAFHIAEDATDDYLKQLVSEVRVTTMSGAPMWIMRGKDNHYLDATALAAAAAYHLGVQRLRDLPPEPPEPPDYTAMNGGSPVTPAPIPGNVEARDAKPDLGDLYKALRGR